MVHGPVREVVRGPSPLDWSTDRGSAVFSRVTRVIIKKKKPSAVFVLTYSLNQGCPGLNKHTFAGERKA